MRLFPCLVLGLLAACPPTEGDDAGVPDAGPRDAGGDDGVPDATLADAGPPPCGTERMREDMGIPTLDGHQLSALVDRPAAEDCRLPTVLIQTPYNKEGVWSSWLGAERESRALFNSPHYNFVAVDWRGRFGSSGLPHAGEGPWLAQDSYDTVEWIAAQPWSDGQVATWGVSALCGAQYRTAAGPRPTAAYPDFNDGPAPHLRAIVPIMCAIRTTYDQVYPGGVLRHEWVSALDILGFGLRTIYESNPRENALWEFAGTASPTERMRVPALVVGGFWDIAPRHTIAAFEELRAASAMEVRDEHRMIIGPWIHFATGGATTEGAIRPLSEEELSYMDVDRRIDADSLAFFDHHLRGLDNGVDAWDPIRYHHAGRGWQGTDRWPPPSTAQRFYLTDGGGLDADAPGSGSVSFDHDPTDPSPTLGGSTLSPFNCLTSAMPLACTLTPDPDNVLIHGPTSQAALRDRTDHAYFETAPVAEPLALLGEGRVFVEISTTAQDTDVAVRLVDVDADGEPLFIGEGIARVSGRDGTRSWSTVTPGTPYEIEVRIHSDLAYDVPAGHRLGLFVSATNWPLFARNPGDGAVFLRGDCASGTLATLQGDPVPATNTIHLGESTRIEIGGP